jgi:thiosulfate dehydrogenase [quinone] large subunit
MSYNSFSASQRNVLILMRLAIGWHFLYEGILKLYNPAWTAKGYLLSSEGIFHGFFSWMASDGMIGITNTLNIVILMFVGAALLLGYLERQGALAGAVLLVLYYLAHPAFPGLDQGITEGNYWLINKNIIEGLALLVIYQFPTSEYFGLKRLFSRGSQEKVANA